MRLVEVVVPIEDVHRELLHSGRNIATICRIPAGAMVVGIEENATFMGRPAYGIRYIVDDGAHVVMEMGVTVKDMDDADYQGVCISRFL